MSEFLHQQLGRLAKVCALFSSNVPGERSAAGARADALLATAQISWADILPKHIAGRRGLLAALAKATSSDSEERATGTAKANGLVKSTGRTWADLLAFVPESVANGEPASRTEEPANTDNPVRARPAPNETLLTRLTLWDQIGFLFVCSSELRDHERETVHALVRSRTVPWEREIRAIILRACRRLEKAGLRAPIVTGDRPGYRRPAAL